VFQTLLLYQHTTRRDYGTEKKDYEENGTHLSTKDCQEDTQAHQEGRSKGCGIGEGHAGAAQEADVDHARIRETHQHNDKEVQSDPELHRKVVIPINC
jgi:hypothetical protein